MAVGLEVALGAGMAVGSLERVPASVISVAVGATSSRSESTPQMPPIIPISTNTPNNAPQPIPPHLRNDLLFLDEKLN